MKYRKLRIAWSVCCGLVAVLLIVMWLRSYFSEDTLFWNASDKARIHAYSVVGRLYLRLEIGTTQSDRNQLSTYKLFPELRDQFRLKESRRRDRFSIDRRITLGQPASYSVRMPFSVWVLASSLAGLLPWLTRFKKFSLRTLLIATTLVAVVLGLVMWELREPWFPNSTQTSIRVHGGIRALVSSTRPFYPAYIAVTPFNTL